MLSAKVLYRHVTVSELTRALLCENTFADETSAADHTYLLSRPRRRPRLVSRNEDWVLYYSFPVNNNPDCDGHFDRSLRCESLQARIEQWPWSDVLFKCAMGRRLILRAILQGTEASSSRNNLIRPPVTEEALTEHMAQQQRRLLTDSKTIASQNGVAEPTSGENTEGRIVDGGGACLCGDCIKVLQLKRESDAAVRPSDASTRFPGTPHFDSCGGITSIPRRLQNQMTHLDEEGDNTHNGESAITGNESECDDACGTECDDPKEDAVMQASSADSQGPLSARQADQTTVNFVPLCDYELDGKGDGSSPFDSPSSDQRPLDTAPGASPAPLIHQLRLGTHPGSKGMNPGSWQTQADGRQVLSFVGPVKDQMSNSQGTSEDPGNAVLLIPSRHRESQPEHSAEIPEPKKSALPGGSRFGRTVSCFTFALPRAVLRPLLRRVLGAAPTASGKQCVVRVPPPGDQMLPLVVDSMGPCPSDSPIDALSIYSPPVHTPRIEPVALTGPAPATLFTDDGTQQLHDAERFRLHSLYNAALVSVKCIADPDSVNLLSSESTSLVREWHCYRLLQQRMTQLRVEAAEVELWPEGEELTVIPPSGGRAYVTAAAATPAAGRQLHPEGAAVCDALSCGEDDAGNDNCSSVMEVNENQRWKVAALLRDKAVLGSRDFDAWAPTPQIFGFYHCEEDPRQSALITQLLSGPDLGVVVQWEYKQARHNVGQASKRALLRRLWWCIGIVRKVYQFHRAGIRHNDLKPGNFMLHWQPQNLPAAANHRAASQLSTQTSVASPEQEGGADDAGDPCGDDGRRLGLGRHHPDQQENESPSAAGGAALAAAALEPQMFCMDVSSSDAAAELELCGNGAVGSAPNGSRSAASFGGLLCPPPGATSHNAGLYQTVPTSELGCGQLPDVRSHSRPLSLEERFERPELMDFGVKLLDLGCATPLTSNSYTGGTPAYQSPELTVLAHHQDQQLPFAAAALPAVDERSDIWALGIALAEILAGVPCAAKLKQVRPHHLREGKSLAEGWIVSPAAWRETLRSCFAPVKVDTPPEVADAAPVGQHERGRAAGQDAEPPVRRCGLAALLPGGGSSQRRFRRRRRPPARVSDYSSATAAGAPAHLASTLALTMFDAFVQVDPSSRTSLASGVELLASLAVRVSEAKKTPTGGAQIDAFFAHWLRPLE